MEGDKELFEMMGRRGSSAAVPQPVTKRSPKVKFRLVRVIGSGCTTALFVAVTVLGYIHPHLGALAAAACFIRWASRIWRWRRG